jgi:hypothetical protein
MKKLLSVICALLLGHTISTAQSFNTGNAEMDTDLNSINVNAKVDLGKFKADLSLSYGVPEPKIDYMLSLNMQPAEVFLALEISNITHTTCCDRVVEVYNKNKGKGWGVIAKEMGIKPGSAEFHELKNKTKGKKSKGNGKKENKGKGNGKGKGKK